MNEIIYFLYLFSIPIKILPINSSKCVVLFLVVLNCFDWIKTKKINTRKIIVELPAVGMLLFLVGFSLLAMLVHQTHQFNVTYAYVLMLAEDFIGTFLFFRYMQNHGNKKDFMDIFITACFIQSALILAMYLSKEFRFWGYEFMGVDRYYLNHRYGGFRGLGFAGSVTYDLAVIQSLALCMMILQLKTCKTGTVFKYLLFFPFILFSVLVSGRTGYIGIAISFLLLLYMIFCSCKNKNAIIYTVFLGQLVFICAVSLSFVSQEIKDSIGKVSEFALELVRNFVETGELKTSSTDKLLAMFWVPPINTLIFGDGYYLNPDNLSLYYRETDSGYMRHLLYYGVFGSVVLYGFYLTLFGKVIKQIKRAGIREHYIWVIMLAAYYFIVHVKGDFLMGSRLGTKAIIGIYFMCQYKFKYQKEMSQNDAGIISNYVGL